MLSAEFLAGSLRLSRGHSTTAAVATMATIAAAARPTSHARGRRGDGWSGAGGSVPPEGATGASCVGAVGETCGVLADSRGPAVTPWAESFWL